MIRKTSLLHKTNPTARRSSFADINTSIGLRRMKCLEKARRACLQVIRLRDHLRGARINLLFTMSDNTRASGKSRPARELVSHERAVCSCWCHTIENVWWSQTGSNRRPPACKAGALPTELWPLQKTEHGPVKDKEVRRLSSDIGSARLHGWKVGGPGKI
jgi:hypothetical protein